MLALTTTTSPGGSQLKSQISLGSDLPASFLFSLIIESASRCASQQLGIRPQQELRGTPASGAVASLQADGTWKGMLCQGEMASAV